MTLWFLLGVAFGFSLAKVFARPKKEKIPDGIVPHCYICAHCVPSTTYSANDCFRWCEKNRTCVERKDICSKFKVSLCMVESDKAKQEGRKPCQANT